MSLGYKHHGVLRSVTGVGSILFNWLSCIHEYHKLRKKETKDRSADIFLLPFSTFPNHMSRLPTSWTCMPTDLFPEVMRTDFFS